MNTQENNKTIAEIIKTQNNNKMIAEFMKHSHPVLPSKSTINYMAEDLEYDNNWNWLMPVVSKCFKTGDDTYEWDNIMDTLFTCDRDIVYAQVVEFINEYNKNK